jgi:hypothetical protein
VRDDMKWAAMHAYRKAVARDMAPAILCPDCQGELVPVVGKDTEPELKCLSCRVVYDIGLDVWDQIEANVHELYENVRVDFD